MPWRPDYITEAELSAFVRVGDDVDDVQVAAAATSASRAIDHHCTDGGRIGRQFGLVDAPEVRYYTPRWSRRRGVWIIEIDDLMTTVGLIVATAAGAITEYDLEPRNAVVKGKPWTRIAIRKTNTVRIEGEDYEFGPTGRWGWTTIPVPVKQAAKLQGSRFLNRRDSPYGIAGSPQQGSELRLLARVDPDVAVSLADFVRKKLVFA
jgi:hypothetical protein